MSGRRDVSLIKTLRGHESRIVLFFLWLPTAEMAVSRVAERVRQEARSIPEPVFVDAANGACTIYFIGICRSWMTAGFLMVRTCHRSPLRCGEMV